MVGGRRSADVGHRCIVFAALARSPTGCYNSSLAMTDRPAHLTRHTGLRGYAYFSYGTWRFS
jgi:hypothetical protein